MTSCGWSGSRGACDCRQQAWWDRGSSVVNVHALSSRRFRKLKEAEAAKRAAKRAAEEAARQAQAKGAEERERLLSSTPASSKEVEDDDDDDEEGDEEETEVRGCGDCWVVLRAPHLNFLPCGGWWLMATGHVVVKSTSRISPPICRAVLPCC